MGAIMRGNQCPIGCRGDRSFRSTLWERLGQGVLDRIPNLLRLILSVFDLSYSQTDQLTDIIQMFLRLGDGSRVEIGNWKIGEALRLEATKYCFSCMLSVADRFRYQSNPIN
ncbi:hypothetical protein AVEN_239693-1 [Araneus ventricosus]|uniref:Uncharacterized protein n=1 Tax=Araneus ventricosus TaxID=182803 RepID=A0A4Y2WZQ1_ARAVE|nr:hypothetical protein AVEN_239693-1 [Araneus ventricosus]